MAEGIVTFISTHKNLSFQIPEKKADLQGKGGVPSKNAYFVNGVYATSDNREISFIKNHDYFKRGAIKDKDVEDAKAARVVLFSELTAKALDSNEEVFKGAVAALKKALGE